MEPGGAFRLADEAQEDSPEVEGAVPFPDGPISYAEVYGPRQAGPPLGHLPRHLDAQVRVVIP